MKTIIREAAVVIAVVALLGANAPSALIYSGTWQIQPPSKGESVNLGLSYPVTMSNDTGYVPLTQLGLTLETVGGAEHAIDFQRKTEAGTFDCNGKIAGGRGYGTFTFVPDEAYAASYDGLRAQRLTPRQQVQAGMFDLRIAYVEGLAAAGFGDVSFETLIGFKIFGVTPEFVRALRSDFPSLDASEVSGAWMVSEKSNALHLLHVDFPNEDLDAIVALAATGVTPEYVAALRTADVHGLTADTVAALHAHGVDQALADRLATKGPHGLTVDEVVQLAKSTPQ